MKKTILKKLCLSAAAVSCAVFLYTSPAAAGQAVFPAKDVELTRDVLTLGDVFENVTQHADHVLAPAPAPGKNMILSTQDLQRIASAFELDWSPRNYVERSIIRRAGQNISVEKMNTVLKNKLDADMKHQNYEIELDHQYRDIVLSAKDMPELSVVSMNFNPENKQFTATLSMTTDNMEKTMDVRGTAHRLIDVPVLRNRIRHGDIIATTDLDYVKMRFANIPSNAILDEAKIIGKTPRRYVDPAKAIHPDSLHAPLAVKKGEKVTIQLDNGILTLTTKGKALESGAKGDTIRIVNTESNRIIEGVVTGPQFIKINSRTL